MNRGEFENEVITLLKPGPMAQTLAQAGIPVTSIDIRRHRPNPAALLPLIRHLRAKKPAILQTWLYHADFFGSIAARFAKPEHLVWNVRSSQIDHRGIRRSTRYLARLLAKLSRWPDAIVVNSHDGQRYHEQIGYRPKQWVNIPNGVDLEHFRPRPEEQPILRARLGIPTDAAVIGFVARYHPMKDIETFLAAASRFQQDNGNVKFILCGDGLGPDNNELAGLIRSLKLERSTVLLGRRSDIELVYPALDLLTLCSIYGEGFPNVLCEAMACDVPCVTTKIGDSAEIIGDHGRIIPLRDPNALADAWRALIDNKQRFGAGQIRTHVTVHYSLKQMCAQYEALYRSLAQRRSKRDCD
jgi:glycosyltransferase involved in cell wall biosynthesis